MKKFLLFCTLILIACSVWADGKCGKNLSWTISGSTLTISGYGQMYNYSNGGAPWNGYKSTVTSVVVKSGARNIGSYAFYGFEKLTYISIPNSVESIGNSAFYGCSSLSSFSLPTSITEMGNSVFGKTAWYNNQADDALIYINTIAYKYKGWPSNTYKGVSIKEGTTVIADECFYNLSQMTSVTIPTSVKYIGERAFYKTGISEVNKPQNVHKILPYTFFGCTSLTTVTIPIWVSEVGRNAFDGTRWFEKQQDGMVYINNVAYKYHGEIPENTSFYFKNGTQSITFGAFISCTNPFTASIPDNFTEIPEGCFKDCKGLTSVSFNNNVVSIGKEAFSGCTNLGNQILPQKISYIGEYAFSGCESIEYLELPDSLKRINYMTFFRCKGLTEVVIPRKVQTIDSNAFSGCSGLKYISIPSNVDSLLSGAYSSCGEINSLVISKGTSPLYMAGSFYNDTINSVYVGRDISVSNTTTNLFNSFEKIQFDKGVTTICSYMFKGYTGKSITIPKNIKTLGNNVLSDWNSNSTIRKIVFEDGGEPLLLGYNDRTFQNIPTKVGLFYDMKQLDSLYIGRNLDWTEYKSNYIEYWGYFYGSPFERCSTIKNVVFGDSVTTIKSNMFVGCENLRSAQLGTAIVSLDFSGSGLDTLRIATVTPPYDGAGIYGKKLITYVPKGTAASWRANRYWKSQIIIDEDEEILFVELTEPGSLASKIIEKGTLPANVAKLKIKGELNDTDWGILKPSSMGQLYYLDLSEVTNDSIPTKQFQNTYSSSTDVSIKDVVFQKTLKRIGDYAFDYCHRLSGDLVLPQTIERIGACAMRGTSFSSIVLPDKEIIAVVDSSAFDRYVGSSSLPVSASTETVWIGKNWKIGTTAFRSNTALKDVTIGRNAKIGEQAFANCNALNTLKLSENTSIGNKAFYANSSLVALNIPGNGTMIGDNAFESCYNLEKVQFEEGLLSIGNYAFNSCNKITGNIQFPSSLQFIGERAFYYAKLIENISFGDNLEIIGNYAFYNCTGLKSIKMGQSIENIGDNAFYGCEQIESLELPLNLRTLGNYAFYGCKKLKELEIHSKIESFGQNNGSFLGCDSIVKVTSHQKTPVGFIYNTFSNNVYKNAELNVPKNSSGNYLLADGWKNFVNFIEFEDSEETETTQIAIINSDGTDATLYVKAGDDVDIQDGIQRLFITRNIPVNTISYTRTFNNNNWQALYVPFDIPVTAEFLEKFEVAYINNVHQYDDDDDGDLDRTIVEFFKMKSGTLKANYPYVIRVRQTGTQIISVDDATLYATAENSVDCRSTQFEYMFKGIYSRLTADELAGCYALSGGEWKPVASGAYLNACRVYLRITPRQDGLKPLKSIGMRFVDGDDDATEIDSQCVNEDPQIERVDVFDLAGRKIENPTQGIYIVNGKKVIIK